MGGIQQWIPPLLPGNAQLTTALGQRRESMSVLAVVETCGCGYFRWLE